MGINAVMDERQSEVLTLMSGQKYKRTNFDDDENTSTAGTPPGVTYDPAIAFKAGASFWQRRTGLERILLVLLVILSLVVVILACILGAKSPSSSSPVFVGPSDGHFVDNGSEDKEDEKTTKKEVCLTPECVTTASSVITAMDPDAHPCNDFYEYACGGWIKSHPIPSGQSRWGTFGVMWKENQLVMKNELEKPLNASNSTAESKARLYYKSCMDEDKIIEKLGDKPLQELLRTMGGWNISTKSGSWHPSDLKFEDQLHKLHSLGLSVFFNTWVGEDEKNVNRTILQFDQDGLGLARDQYLNKSIRDDKTLSAYLKFMIDLGELLGGDRNETEEQMYKVIEFEQRIANITVPAEDRRDDMKLYHKMKLSKLQEIAPFVNWVDYVNNLMSKRTSPITVRDNEEVVVFAPDFLGHLSAIIKEMEQTDEGKNTLNNYMLWHLSKLMASYLSKPFRDAKKEFSEVLSGVTGYEENWRYCTTDTDSTVGFALGAMFVREAFKNGSKGEAVKMIKEIKEAFTRNLPNLSWMDKETRESARAKARAVIDMIGFPEYILNKTALDERYEKLEIKQGEYFMNNVRDLQFVMTRNMDKYRKAPDKKSWSMTPPTVNAYYTPTKNEIVFPAGILQAPFYSKEYPKSLNFGGMGVVMGHELTHGFDDQGREYDKTGILRPWWNNDSVARFKERAQCMVDQYSSYKVNEDNIKGKQTLGENIADNGGLKSAYNAYIDWVKLNGEEKPLPGMNLTHKQLFFVAFAQVWCSNTKPQSDHMAILTDPHSPAKYRVIGPVSNSREFAEQFNCPKNSPMNPDKKCEVW